MSGIALDLDRPAHLALDQHSAGKAIDRHGGSEERAACPGSTPRAPARKERSIRRADRHIPRRLPTPATPPRPSRNRGGWARRAIPPRVRETRARRSPARDGGASELFEAPPDQGEPSSPAGFGRLTGTLSSTGRSGSCFIGGTLNSLSIDRPRYGYASRAPPFLELLCTVKAPGPSGTPRFFHADAVRDDDDNPGTSSWS